jgi:CPA1 family monovalent cation:H+ antiporter
MSVGGTVLHGVGEFFLLAGGGALVGGVVAAGVILLRRQITDPVLETVVALITPYVAYLLGETLHLSGVTAVIVAGLVIGAWRPQITTAQTRLQLHAVYQTVIFVLESVVFSLIGLELPTLVRDLGNARHWLEGALAVAATLIATRVAWVFPAWAITQRRRGVRRPSWAVPAVVSWAGTRGVVPLAAALSIPLTTTSGAPLPQRDLVLVLAAATIVISLVVQGFTLEPLARFAGFGRDAAADPLHEETVARLRLAEAGLARLDELAEDGAAPDAVIDRLRDGLQARIGKARVRLDEGPDAESGTLTERELRGDLIAAENSELARLFEDGTISAATRQRLQRSLDLEIARLTEGHR